MALAAERAFPEAAEVMAQALELAPWWAAGWDMLGQYRKQAGDVAGAISAWTELLAHDNEGVFGARLKLAAHGVGGDRSPAPDYVAALFDDYAPRFETSLVDGLGYSMPDELAAALISVLASRPARQVRRAIDLGCGTGLMGERLRPLVDWLEGVDLSTGMLARAKQKGIYDRLERAELVAFLEAETAGCDLIVAADVFNYVGDLAPALIAARRVLAPSGLLAFTLETHPGEEPVVLTENLRFQHSGRHATELCRSIGFHDLVAAETVIRTERGEPVGGLIVVARAGLAVIEGTPDGGPANDNSPVNQAA